MKYIKAIIIGFTLINLISCGPKTNNLIQKCVYEKSFYKWSDSSYVTSFVGDIVSYKDNLYIADVTNGRYVVLDNNLTIVKILGKPGPGPGEFLAPSNITFYKDSAYICDFKKNTMSVFDPAGAHIRTYMNRERPESIFMRRKQDGVLVMSTSFKTTPISCYDLAGNYSGGFGNIYNKYVPANEKRINVYNVRNIQPLGDDNIVALFRSQPVIEVYDYKGNIKLVKEINDIKYVKEIYETINNKPETITFLFRSIVTKNNHIYVLAQHVYSDNTFMNLILEFTYSNNDLIYNKCYILEQTSGTPTSYACFNILNDNKIIAFNWLNKTMDVFNIVGQ